MQNILLLADTHFYQHEFHLFLSRSCKIMNGIRDKNETAIEMTRKNKCDKKNAGRKKEARSCRKVCNDCSLHLCTDRQ
jgi:hypothetical protein